MQCSGKKTGIRSSGLRLGSDLTSDVTGSQSPPRAKCVGFYLSNEANEVFPDDLVELVFVGYFSCSQCTNPR